MKDYSKAYTEVIEVLKYFSKDDYDKIPSTFLNFLEKNRDEKYSFKYNLALPIEKQDISYEAKVVLALIYSMCL